MNERLAITRRLLRAMRHESGRAPMDDYDADGVRQIVVCVPSDTVAYACEQVKAVGGRATVVTPFREGLIPLAWTVSTTPDGVEEPHDGPMHPDSTMGVLVDWWAASGTHDYTFRLTTGDGNSMEVTEGPQITIPA